MNNYNIIYYVYRKQAKHKCKFSKANLLKEENEDDTKTELFACI